MEQKKDLSPLKEITIKIRDKVSKRLQKKRVIVDYAMNYGKPSLEKVIRKLFSNGCTKILFLPMYPQYSATTTASVVDKVSRVMQKMRWQPTIRFCPPYFDDDLYITALKNQIIKEKKNRK